MNSFEKLVKIFEEFPGIGPRQARRFVYFLLSKKEDYLEQIGGALREIKKEIGRCEKCFRYFSKQKNDTRLCSICTDSGRDQSILMLVSKDADLLAIERSGFFKGYFFVLGGLVPVLEKNPEQRIRANDLLRIIKERAKENLKEIIFAFSATNEGENTALFLENYLKEEISKNNIKITHLGRGLSTGSELEYADKDTIKAALENKK